MVQSSLGFLFLLILMNDFAWCSFFIIFFVHMFSSTARSIMIILGGSKWNLRFIGCHYCLFLYARTLNCFSSSLAYRIVLLCSLKHTIFSLVLVLAFLQLFLFTYCFFSMPESHKHLISRDHHLGLLLLCDCGLP